MSLAEARAEVFLELAEGQIASGAALVGQRILGTTMALMGRPRAARRHLQQALDEPRYSELTALYGKDMSIAAQSILALVLWQLGRPVDALGCAGSTLARAETLGCPNTLGYALTFAGGILSALIGEGKHVRSHAESLLELADQHELPLWRAIGDSLHGIALGLDGRLVEGITGLRRSLIALDALHAARTLPMGLDRDLRFYTIGTTWLAELYAMAGEVNAGLAAVAELESILEAGAERWFEAEVFRVKARLLQHHAPGDDAAAEAALLTALRVSRSQGAMQQELKAATELARLWRRRGQGARAIGMLAPLLKRFPEHEAGRDLDSARDVLDGLG